VQDLAAINMKDADGSTFSLSLSLFNSNERHSGLKNAIKLMKHPDSYIYKAASKDDKTKWLATLKTVTDDFMRNAGKRAAAASSEMSSSGTTATSTPSAKSGRGWRASFSSSKPLLAAKSSSVSASDTARADKPNGDDEGAEADEDVLLIPVSTLASLGLVPAELTQEQWKDIVSDLDELDVLIAQRQFDLAVALVNKRNI